MLLDEHLLEVRISGLHMTDLTAEELPAALSRADADRSWRRRDLLWAVLTDAA
jgi:hypothetical protein